MTKIPVIGQIRTHQDTQRALENIREYFIASQKQTAAVSKTSTTTIIQELGGGGSTTVINNTTAGFLAPTTLTVNNGVLTLPAVVNPFRFHFVALPAGYSSGNLLSISGGNPYDLLLLQAASASQVITLVQGTVAPCIDMAGVFTLSIPARKILLICMDAINQVWHEISVSANK